MREGFRESAEGYIQDALMQVMPLSLIRHPSPVRSAIHGTDDDWERIANLQRVVCSMPDVQVVALEGLNHFGSIMFPDLAASLCLGTLGRGSPTRTSDRLRTPNRHHTRRAGTTA